MRKGLLYFTLLFGIALFAAACKNKDASVLKIYVRSSSNELLTNAKVVIIGDVNSTPATAAYVDTLLTNDSGFATFILDAYYEAAGEDNDIAYFDIIAKKDGKTGKGYVRTKAHITAVETVYLEN